MGTFVYLPVAALALENWLELGPKTVSHLTIVAAVLIWKDPATTSPHLIPCL